MAHAQKPEFEGRRIALAHFGVNLHRNLFFAARFHRHGAEGAFGHGQADRVGRDDPLALFRLAHDGAPALGLAHVYLDPRREVGQDFRLGIASLAVGRGPAALTGPVGARFTGKRRVALGGGLRG